MGRGRVAAVLVSQGRGAAKVGRATMVYRKTLARSSVLVDVASRFAEGTFAVQGALLAGNEFVVGDLCCAAGTEGTIRPGGIGVDRRRSGSSDVLRAGSVGSGYFRATS